MRAWRRSTLVAAGVLASCSGSVSPASTGPPPPATVDEDTTAPSSRTTEILTTSTVGITSSITDPSLVSGPFVVAQYLDLLRDSSYLKLMPLQGDRTAPIVLDDVRNLESDGAGGVIFGWWGESSVWHWASGGAEPTLVAEVESSWSVDFIDGEPHLVFIDDMWEESEFGWCDGDPCFGDEGYQMGTGQRTVRLVSVPDGRTALEHTEPFEIGLSGVSVLLPHSFIAGGSQIAFVRSQIPDMYTPKECEQVEFRSMTNEVVTMPANPFAEPICDAWLPLVELHGLKRDGNVMVYEESVDGRRELVMVDLESGDELSRITTSNLVEDPLIAYWVDFDPSGVLALFWVDTETEQSYTEIIDMHGDTVTMSWPLAEGAGGVPTVSYLPAVDVDLTQLSQHLNQARP